MHFSESLHLSTFHCIFLHFSEFFYIYQHFSAFFYTSLHFSEYLYISLHFYESTAFLWSVLVDEMPFLISLNLLHFKNWAFEALVFVCVFLFVFKQPLPKWVFFCYILCINDNVEKCHAPIEAKSGRRTTFRMPVARPLSSLV